MDWKKQIEPKEVEEYPLYNNPGFEQRGLMVLPLQWQLRRFSALGILMDLLDKHSWYHLKVDLCL